jgi:hypothetical protein
MRGKKYGKKQKKCGADCFIGRVYFNFILRMLFYEWQYGKR